MKFFICIFLFIATTLQAECRSFDIILDEILKDNIKCNGELGYRDNRDQLTAMILDSNTNGWDYLIFIDRNIENRSTCFGVHNYKNTKDLTLLIEDQFGQPVYSTVLCYYKDSNHIKCINMIKKEQFEKFKYCRIVQ